MSTYAPFIRRRQDTSSRTVTTRPPAPPRPTLRQPPIEQQPLMDPATGSAAPMASSPTVVQNVTTAPASGTVAESTTSYIAPDAIITTVVGGLILALGLVTIARLGLGGSVLRPVENVLGVPHTPLLGLVEIGVGLVFVILGVLAARAASIVLGAVLAVAGAIVVIAVNDFDADLALTRELGWWAIIAGGVVALANLLLPSIAVGSDDSRQSSIFE